ncbi:MAG: TRAP transporter small permease subunit [Thalassovita sp.]|nr:TRAP transporter small permease subunit [Thalassovita sp.]
MQDKIKGIVGELGWPLLFLTMMGYLAWYLPHLIIAFGGADANGAIVHDYRSANIGDYLVVLVLAVALVMGVRTATTSAIEDDIDGFFDRVSVFFGRVTALLISILVFVMLFEVVLRYIFEKPTLWANELSLWMAGFIFLLAGLYAMQQRSHIRIFLLYDLFPRPLQKLADTVSVVLIWAFTVAMIWGAYNEAKAKLLRWETFGTAFDPPIPATLKSMVLIVITLVAIQALSNLIADWSKAPQHHSPVDEDEIAELKHELEEQLHLNKDDEAKV